MGQSLMARMAMFRLILQAGKILDQPLHFGQRFEYLLLLLSAFVRGGLLDARDLLPELAAAVQKAQRRPHPPHPLGSDWRRSSFFALARKEANVSANCCTAWSQARRARRTAAAKRGLPGSFAMDEASLRRHLANTVTQGSCFRARFGMNEGWRSMSRA
ncbi:unnamed protein product [Cladocopium goreaui]|nr:unnamed protein product [Cladocopium goreaui]